MPDLAEWLHLDNDAYRKKICRPYYSDQELSDNIYRKRREINVAGWSVGANFALVPITGGLSALGLPVAGRSLQIARQKLQMLEHEWARRGYTPLPTHVIRDGVIPCAVAGAVGAAGIGLDSVFGAAGSSAVNHAGMAGGQYVASAAMHAQAMPPPGTGHQFGSGIMNGVQQTIGVLQGHGAAYSVASPNYFPAYAAGQAAGMNVVHQGINYGVQKFGDWAQEQSTHMHHVW